MGELQKIYDMMKKIYSYMPGLEGIFFDYGGDSFSYFYIGDENYLTFKDRKNNYEVCLFNKSLSIPIGIDLDVIIKELQKISFTKEVISEKIKDLEKDLEDLENLEDIKETKNNLEILYKYKRKT